MAPPRHFGSACEVDDVLASGQVDGATGSGPGFRWILLQRHGRRPLAVLARALLQANNRCAGLSCWSEISIYETNASRFAVCLHHAPPEAGGLAWCDAWICDVPEAVQATLYRHDPLIALTPCHIIRPDAPSRIPTGDPGESAMLRDAAVQDVLSRRLRGAWAGLLAAMFGLPVPHQVAA